jgi:hypothetical protein
MTTKVRRLPPMTRAYDQCMRCGKATQWGHSVCRDCNPAGLPEPSPSQYHATVFAVVLIVMVVLAVIGIALR